MKSTRLLVGSGSLTRVGSSSLCGLSGRPLVMYSLGSSLVDLGYLRTRGFYKSTYGGFKTQKCVVFWLSFDYVGIIGLRETFL